MAVSRQQVGTHALHQDEDHVAVVWNGVGDKSSRKRILKFVIILNIKIVTHVFDCNFVVHQGDVGEVTRYECVSWVMSHLVEERVFAVERVVDAYRSFAGDVAAHPEENKHQHH